MSKEYARGRHQYQRSNSRRKDRSSRKGNSSRKDNSSRKGGREISRNITRIRNTAGVSAETAWRCQKEQSGVRRSKASAAGAAAGARKGTG